MTIANGYTTASDIKNRLGIAGTDSDAVIEQCVEAASRAIDRYCRRTFYGETGARYYTAQVTDEVIVDDIGTSGAITVQTDDDGDGTHETTWASADFTLIPRNAAPHTRIAVTPSGTYAFPVGIRDGVKVTAAFGYSCGTSGGTGSVPDPVVEATALLALKLFKRKDAPFGIAGVADMGQVTGIPVPSLDPDVKFLLGGYVRLQGADT